ncbi:MAG: NlpC/P60 family protein [Eubacteriales bacterium]|nr:NlpC/P60 family protein [Eubacteriales bacterium]
MSKDRRKKYGMRRKNLWKKIAYITIAVAVAMATPAVSVLRDFTVFAEEEASQVYNADAQSTEPQASAESQPSTEAPTEPPTEGPTEPPTEGPTESEMPTETEAPTEPSTETEAPTETPDTPSTEPETEPVSESESETEEESETESETESESESESETELESEIEDHSILNANWKTNIIASNASYLGQLSSAYGISIDDDFGEVMDSVEKEFSENLTDPANFQATNWKDVFAVYIYELKKQTGSAKVSAASRALLLDVFTRMNAPEEALDIAPRKVDIAEVFVEEYPIEENLEQIDEQQAILVDIWANIPGNMGDFAETMIEADAQEARKEQYARQQEEMEQARYEKWLRMQQKQETRANQKLETYSTEQLIPRTISDYVEMNGLSKADQKEIEKYASTECLQLCAIASAAPQIVRASVGNDISEERVRIVTAAYSLVGKVGYFWGGKSSAIGWDPAWGSPAKVTAAGSTSSGMTRNYGLDCSGYVQYCYRNGLDGNDGGIGGHTTTQWNASVMVDQANVQPGDLVFYGGPERGDLNHVGVVVGKSVDGGLIVAHCSSSRNGVVVGEAWTSGFRYVRTVTSLK